MVDRIPLSEQIRLFQHHQTVSSQKQSRQRIKSPGSYVDPNCKQSPTKMSSLSRSPAKRSGGSVSQNRLLQYFAKNEQTSDLYDNYMRRSADNTPNRQNNASQSPITSPDLNDVSRKEANALIARELGGSPIRSKSPYMQDPRAGS